MVVTLSDSDLIANGARQYVYNHPWEPLEVIKMTKKHPQKVRCRIVKNIRSSIMPYKQHMWTREAYESYRQYMNVLATSNMCPNYIAGHRGFVQTSIGVGCVYEKICDDGGSYRLSLTINDIIRQGNYNRSDLIEVVDIFFEDLYRDRVQISDLHLDNLCVVRTSNGVYKRVVLIDGLGYRTLFPPSISKRVYSRWHQQQRTSTLARMGQLMRETNESIQC